MSSPIGTARRHGTQFEAIPRVLHQTWKTAEVPAWGHRDSWRLYHPGWELKLWTDEDNRRLIAERYPWFLATYEAFARPIQRVDAAKYFLMYTYGGVYADLDCECRRPVDEILERGGAIVTKTPDGVVDAAFLASPPNHPLWLETFKQMQRPPWWSSLFLKLPLLIPSHVLFTTGPRMLKRATRRYIRRRRRSAEGPGINVFDPGTLAARSWLRRYQEFEQPEAFLHHHYRDSWLTPGEVRLHKHFTIGTLYRLLVALAFLMVLAALAIL